MGKSAINIGVQMSLQHTDLISFGKTPGVGLLDCMGVLLLIF
jgi:hypothetical protein